MIVIQIVHKHNHDTSLSLTLRSLTHVCWGLVPGYRGQLVMPNKSRYNRFPSAANGWGTKHHIPDTVPPLLGEEKGPPT
jgi:hypothetical protein